MKGLGTDDEILIHILGNRSTDQRVQIRDKYKVMFGRVCLLFYPFCIEHIGFITTGSGR